jgi:hypothetical protein
MQLLLQQHACSCMLRRLYDDDRRWPRAADFVTVRTQCVWRISNGIEWNGMEKSLVELAEGGKRT